MLGLILAGGEGSRLAADGIAEPKAVVSVAGVPQLSRLVQQLIGLGCDQVVAVVRAGFQLPPLMPGSQRNWSVEVYRSITPSPVHTLALGLERLPPGPVFCTAVDTVMPAADWAQVFEQSGRDLETGAAASVAVTPYVDDDRALYVESDRSRRVVSFTDQPRDPVLVTGGIYALSPVARGLVPELIEEGVTRMRSYLRRLLEQAALVRAVIVPRIVDLDRASDLDAANALLGSGHQSVT